MIHFEPDMELFKKRFDDPAYKFPTVSDVVQKELTLDVSSKVLCSRKYYKKYNQKNRDKAAAERLQKKG